MIGFRRGYGIFWGGWGGVCLQSVIGRYLSVDLSDRLCGLSLGPAAGHFIAAHMRATQGPPLARTAAAGSLAGGFYFAIRRMTK